MLSDEFVTSQEIEFLQKSEVLVGRGIDMMKTKYGAEGVTPKEYHNEKHASTAVYFGDKIASLEGVSDHDRCLVKVALAFHDIDSNSGIVSEERSAMIAEEVSLSEGIEPEDVEIVKELIMATKVRFEKGVVYQSVEYTSDDSKMQERVVRLKKIVADADMYLSGDTWENLQGNAVLLGREFGILPKQGGSESEMKDFWSWEANFLEGIRKRGYYTESAKLAYQHLDSNIVKCRALSTTDQLSYY